MNLSDIEREDREYKRQKEQAIVESLVCIGVAVVFMLIVSVLA